jgi:uncharacterized protein YkwD
VLVVVALTLTWAFLLVLALALLRSAGTAERDAERRLQEARPRDHAPEQRRRKAVTTAVMVAALPLAGASVGVDDADAGSCRGARLAPGGLAPTATVCLINAQRRARGLPPLVANPRLGTAARRHAADMVARAFFSHVSPTGSSFADRLRRVGYARASCAWSGGETLAWGAGSTATPASRVRGWMNSPGHRAILLNASYREIGIGVTRGSPTNAGAGATYVGEFGRRRC